MKDARRLCAVGLAVLGFGFGVSQLIAPTNVQADSVCCDDPYDCGPEGTCAGFRACSYDPDPIFTECEF